MKNTRVRNTIIGLSLKCWTKAIVGTFHLWLLDKLNDSKWNLDLKTSWETMKYIWLED